MAHGKPRKQPFERRTLWVFVLAVLASVFPFGLLSFSGPEVWNVALYVAAQAALVAAVATSGLALAPAPGLLPTQLRREPGELLFWAIALIWVAVLLTAVSVSITAVDSIGDPSF